MQDDSPGAPRFASPPCFMHEIAGDYLGLPPAADPQQALDVARWRRAERRRLKRARSTLSEHQRADLAQAMADSLERIIAPGSDTVIAAFWPINREPDLRAWMRAQCENGARVALPVVVKKAHPLVFREWRPDAAMAPGFWGIPIPRDGAGIQPTVIVLPLVGFDPAGHRLGNGGGYYDRTLAAFEHHPLTIGVGYAQAAIPTIYPQPHDIALDWIVTGDSVIDSRPTAAPPGR